MTVLDDDSTAGSPRALIDQPGPQSLVVADWAAASVQGRRRLRNEDSWKQLGPVFAVADGMGGLSAGDKASAIAAHTIANEWLSTEELAPEQVVRRANFEVLQLAGDTDTSGSTVTAIRIAHDQATVIHVGDSRVYRLRDGHAELLTRDHNLRSELLAAGIMPGNTKSLGPLRALTSYLGKADEDLLVDIRSVSLRHGDRLVLCTDGVFDEMSHSEFASRAGNESAAVAVNRLTALQGSDDATALIVDIAADPAI